MALIILTLKKKKHNLDKINSRWFCTNGFKPFPSKYVFMYSTIQLIVIQDKKQYLMGTESVLFCKYSFFEIKNIILVPVRYTRKTILTCQALLLQIDTIRDSNYYGIPTCS